MFSPKHFLRLTACAAAATIATECVHANFVQFVVTAAQTSSQGQDLVVYNVYARFNGPTDTLLNLFNVGPVAGSTFTGFWHKDNASYNSGVLSQEYGTWNPALTGSTTANRPFDSYVTVGSIANPTNATSADPGWTQGGNADSRSWNRPDIPTNGGVGWFNSNPPNLQGRVGVNVNTATDVRVGQFVLSQGHVAKTFVATIGYNSGVPNSGALFATAQFTLGETCPTLYRDADGDGFGSAGSGVIASCAAIPGYVSNDLDCNDTSAAINPNAPEICDGSDNNCNSQTDEGLTGLTFYQDADSDTFGNPSVTTVACDGVPPAGFVANSDDCDDADATLNPNTEWYRDIDGDGFGSSGDGTVLQCTAPDGYVRNGSDNCPSIANPDQRDCDNSGVGDACEIASGELSDCDQDGVADACEGGERVERSSPLLAPFGAGVPVAHTFSNLLSAYGDPVQLRLEVTSDLDLASEFIAVSFDGGAQEFFFVNDGRDCPATPDVAVRTFTIPAFNALVADGTLTVSVVASGTVSATQCTGGGVRISLAYDGLQAGNDCNGNGVLDSCEIGDGVAFDCNGNGVLDACDAAAGLGTDCNGNGRLDSCDLASGTSTDLNGNGVLDECAGEWIVGGSGYATIQQAIDAAPSGTTIRVGPGTYAGPIVIDSKQIVLASIAGYPTTTLSGSGLGTSIVHVTGAGAGFSLIEGFTFRDGSVGFDFGGFRVGGAISALNVPSLTIRHSVFVDNSAGYGGGVYLFGGSGQLSDCIFSGNSAATDGGAVQIGGGGTWQVARCTITGNTASIGGGMHTWSSSVVVSDTRFFDNSATGTGGAISWFSVNAPQLRVDSCVLEGNAAGNGGGIGLLEGTGLVDLDSTRFCRNSPQNITASFNDLGGNVFSQDCDDDGVCDDEEIAIASSASFVWGTDAGGDGKRYLRVTAPATWERANTRAQAMGGNLAVITGAAEQAAVHAALGGTLAWLGAAQPAGSAEPDGGWAWVTGEPWSYTNWYPGEPSERPGFPGEDRLMWFADGRWNDSGCPDACFYEIGSIIELDETAYNRSRDCNGNGVPDGCDIDAQTASDCNGNSIPDSCEVASGALADCNANGIADICELGGVAAWGENNNGQTTLPADIAFARAISAGCNHGLALGGDGAVSAWGSNTFGQRTVPSSVVQARLIAAGCDHSLAVLADGTVRGWGYNAFNQCTIPVAANGDVVQVAAGANHSGVRKSNGQLVLWGRNIDGECNVPGTLGAVSGFALGGAHSVGLRADGTIVCWGLNNFGQTTVPASVGTLQAVAAGCYHTVGLRTDGTVVAWGSTLFGQTTVPAGLTNVVAIAAGSGQHTLALRANGSVVSWGWNAFGQTDVPSTASFIDEIAAGGTFSLARRGSAVDCNSNGAIDSCEIAAGTAADCDANGIPDACDLSSGAADCNGNGIPDSCDLASGLATDCNANGTLDSCDLAGGAAFDCDGNGRIDTCDVAMGMGSDCNGNGKLDTCDLAAGTSTDLNGNGVLDECSGEFVVGGSGFRTVQAAIDAAPAGTTVRVGPGTYTGGIDLSTKPLTLRSIAGAAATVLSGSGLDRSIMIIRTAAADGSEVDGFTFTGGVVGTAEFGTRLGGALLLIETQADVRNCRFIDNQSTYGGAIYAYRHTGIVEQCAFESNHALDDAGAAQFGFGGTFTFRNNTLSQNSCGRNGGALQVVQWLDGPTTVGSIESCTFRDNLAGQDGGALAWFAASGADLPIVNCTVESNGGTTGAFKKNLSDAIPGLAFAVSGSRFCLNPGGNIDGPFIDLGGNTFSQDCNRNGICDADEIAGGSEVDCDGDGFPDSCQLSRVLAWGENSTGQATVPDGLGPARTVSAGCNHALAIRANGTVAAWGANSFGQTAVPAGLDAASQIAAGCDHSLALSKGGVLYAWGYNAFNQCVIPSAANGNIAQIAAGANHSGVRKNDGSLVLWGRNIDGECNVPGTLGAVATFALGGAHSVGLRANGTVACWGLNNFGQCTVPASVGTLREVAAGCYHTVGLRTNGTVVAWGSTLFGQTTVPAGLAGVVDIAAGSGQHTLALLDDGSVVGWGWNAFGQTNVPFTVTAARQVSAGGTFSLALLAGSDDCNNNGQIDSCELAANPALDCNGNGVPDSCDLADGAPDCNGNGRPDSCDLATGAPDCNGNGVPDSCDISSGVSTDLNANLVPDECAGEWIVGGSGFRTIQAAVTAAPSGTTIRVGPGTYNGATLINGKSVQLVSLAGAENTILSGTGLGTSIIAVRTAAANGFVIDGFTFRDGTVGTAAFDTLVGGALFLDNVSGAVRNCRFLDNRSQYGGALYSISFSGTIEQCVFTGNSAAFNSGAVQIGFGGTSVFRNNVLENNSAASGGALHVVNWDNGPLTSATVENCVFRGNSATFEGGALLWYGATGSNLPIRGCTVESNSAPDAAFTRIGGTLAFDFLNTRFCLNQPTNVNDATAINDLGGNTFSQDCNRNGICDADEIASGSESDCNANGIPDSCELAGTLLAFGDGGLGQLAIPSDLGRPLAIATGCDHSLALRADGTVRAWGQNTFGQATVPADLPSVQAITAGCDHTLALTTSGGVRAWGYNAFGQCNVPAISGTIVEIAAGANHSGVRRSDGSLVLWGRNVDGECNVPAGLGPVVQLALGGAHSVGRRADGTIVCWGLNNFGQCNVPANVGTLQSVAAGCYHTVGLRTNGTVVAWGSSLFGQTSVPGGLNNVIAIAAGSGQHTLALKSNGTVVAWGWNAFGQSTVPAAAVDVIKIAAGGTHSMALTRPAADCNGNNQIDSCEIANGTQSDCNANGVLDSCELASGLAADCNKNGVLDSCDIANGTPDCNGNGRPDTCDLALGSSTDLNGNTVPDECSGEFVVGGSGYATIQAAIDAAPDGATIGIAPGSWPPFTVQGRRLTIASFAGAETTFVDGGGTQRAASLSNIAPLGVLIDGLTFRNGSAPDGAGMKLLLASPKIANCVFEDNVTTGPGGGVCCFSSSPLFESCVIRNNAALRGGGVWVAGIAQDGGFAQFDQCVISFNDAAADGAGIGNEGRVLLTGCFIESNIAGVVGGGLRTLGAAATSAVGSSFFCLNVPDNTSGMFTDLTGNILGDDCNSNGVCDIDEIAAGAEDKNQNGKLDTCELARGDLNLDEVINAADLSVLLNFWGASNPPAGDLNGDGIITAADLAIMLNNWGGT